MTIKTILGDVELFKEIRPTLKSTINVIWFLMKPDWLLHLSILVLSVMEGVLGGAMIAALFPLISAFAGGGIDATSFIFRAFQRVTLLLPFQSQLTSSGVLLVVIVCLKSSSSWAVEALTGYGSARVNYRLRRDMFDRYIGGGYQFFVNHRQGELVYNLYNSCLRVGTLFAAIPHLLMQVINALALLVLLVAIQPKATVVLIIVAGVFQASVSMLTRKNLFDLGKRKKDSRIVQFVMINEFITGFKQLFLFGAVPVWHKVHDDVTREYMKMETKEFAIIALPKNVWEFFVFGTGAAALVWLGRGPQADLATKLPAFGVYFIALQRLLPFMSAMGKTAMTITGLIPDANIAHNALTTTVPSRTDGTILSPVLNDAVRFENVAFGYSDRDILLTNASFEIQKGKTTAIVGESGSGKTTVLNLILGLMQPTGGRITIDGQDMAGIKLSTWLDQIGFVSQDSFIYNGSIQENIAFSRNCTKEEIENAARLANAHEFIAAFPAGYDTRVGDRGMKLSGGQQQRIAIARAMLRNPRVLILDEATSSLDSVSEVLIQDALRQIAANRTVLVVAHRLSTIVNADKILVMKNGVVIEQGNHKELMSLNGAYSNLYGIQKGFAHTEERVPNVV